MDTRRISGWVGFFAVCWGLAFAISTTKGCANPGADYHSSITTLGPDGRPTKVDDVRAGVRLPKNLDALKGFEIGRDSVKIGSLSNFRVQAGGWYFAAIGIALLLVGGLVAFGAVPYVSVLIGGPQPVAGGVVAGVGGFCLVWPSIEGGVSVILLVAVACAAALGLAYVWGRYLQAAKTYKRARRAKAKLDAEGKADEGTAALRVGDPALDRAMAEASAARAAITGG